MIILISLNVFSQVDLSVMTLNIWNEGITVSNATEKIRDVILKANPDIVGFEEVRNTGSSWTTKVTNLLALEGQNYYGSFTGGDISIISKFPILDSIIIDNEGNSIAAFTISVYGNNIIVVVGHLDYMFYASYLPRGYNGGNPDWSMIDDGCGHPAPVKDVTQILSYNLLSKREEQITDFLKYIQGKTEPIVFMGDFNEPSFLDWTSGTANTFDHNAVVIPCQCTKILSDNGFVDAYRNYFPNEIDNPGITWPSYAHGLGSTSWTPLADERDRIDFIFFKGDSIQTTYAALVGPRESFDHNVLTTTFTENENFIADSLEWPSDHKAVFVKLTFQKLTKASNNVIKK